MKLLGKIPFFLILLPVFFCLHGGLENFGVISFWEAVRTGFYIAAGIAVLYLLLWYVIKSRQNASLVSFYIAGFYIFFGALHNWLQENPALSFLNRYIIVLPLFLLTGTAIAWFLKRKTLVQQKIFLYLNVLLLIYCLLDIGLLVNKAINKPGNAATAVSFNHRQVNAKPNVYFLLFDEYPGYKSLYDAFNFRNDSLYHFLQQNQFSVLPSFANYNFTAFSMSSVFNMQYVPDDYDHKLVNQHDVRNRYIEIKNASVFSIYRSMGYQIENYSIFDVGNQPCINPDQSFLPVHSRVLTTKMLHNCLRKDIGWWFKGSWLKSILAKPEAIYQADETNQDILRSLQESLQKKHEKPVFAYAHFMMPHAPYFRDSSGAPVKKNNGDSINLNDTRYFLPYLKYTNSVITSLVNDIVLKDPAAIVVIMSDHGFRDYEHHLHLQQPSFDNICAVRLPGIRSTPVSATISTVNFFRYLFNTAYGQQFPLLKDSTSGINY